MLITATSGLIFFLSSVDACHLSPPSAWGGEDVRDSVPCRIFGVEETDLDRLFSSTTFSSTDLPPVEASPLAVSGAPPPLLSRSPAFAPCSLDLMGDGKGGTSKRLAGTEKDSIMSKAMLRKISMREGGKTRGSRSAVSKTISKGRLCGVNLGASEAENFTAFLNESV